MLVLSLSLVMGSLPIWAQDQSDDNAWTPADPKADCAGVEEPSLCAELLAMLDRDQIVRRKLVVGHKDPALDAEISKIDKANQERLKQILVKHGWPTDELMGAGASGAAWTIVQHADLPFQRKLLPTMREAADQGHLEKGLLAYTIDRIRIGEGKPQLHGTQFKEEGGHLVPQPIEDEANVDKRRAAVGLPPLAEYAEFMNQFYKTQPPATPTPAQADSN